MTPEEIDRFALMLAEADKVRARIDEDERADSTREYPSWEDRLEAAA